MPLQLSYPGVYIQEIPSGVRTIIGVATSITAFVGGARKGPTDKAVPITSFGDYKRYFGELHPDSYLGYAVSHFFANGGSQARVVRLAHPQAVVAQGSGGGLNVSASSAGAWANTVKVYVTPAATSPGRFSLRVTDVSDPKNEVVLESYNGLSLDKADSRYVQHILDEDSLYLNFVSGDQQPSDGSFQLSGGDDGPVAVLTPDMAEFQAAVNPGPGTPPAIDGLNRLDLFNLLCVPGLTEESVLAQLQSYSVAKRAFLIVDAQQTATAVGLFANGPDGQLIADGAKNSAIYFPWVKAADPLRNNRLREFPPSGFVAGVYARTDAARGVWKAPAGTEATMTGVAGMTAVLTDLENGWLNPKGINCLRQFPVYGQVVWGARTLDGADERASDHKYVPVRRITLYIEESLYRGTKWAVFEPNDEPLWGQLRLNVGAFMHDLFRQGAFQGRAPREAYFVKCDKETTTQSDINRGVVNVLVGFAPLKPAEFVVLSIQQMAGQIET